MKTPTVDKRDTCLSNSNANISYVVNMLNKYNIIVKINTNAVSKALVCSVDSESFIKGVCSECKDRCIVYQKSN